MIKKPHTSLRGELQRAIPAECEASALSVLDDILLVLSVAEALRDLMYEPSFAVVETETSVYALGIAGCCSVQFEWEEPWAKNITIKKEI